MSKHPSVPFTISHMDSLGQGVSKTGPKVTFIPKTLPGEEGEAVIQAERKGVAFAKLKSLDKPSNERVKPECPHFDQCPSCHYLHTSYEQEIEFKKASLEKMFQRIEHPSLEVIPAPRRLQYRNRVQLHYDLKRKMIGMQDVGARTIAPIPHCLIARPEILEEIGKLYAHQHWLSEAPPKPETGHVEIYSLNGKVQKSWNRPYAEGGFTQVFEEMNQVLRSRLKKWWGDEQHTLLDLFGGNGNLSRELSYSRRLCVDVYTKDMGDDFISQSLYDDDALKKIIKTTQKKGLEKPHLLLDPPRSGLKNLNEWLDAFAPQKVAYVSCDPHTLVRDISALKNYVIEELILLDFFPSTFHFETVIFLKRQE